MQNDHTFTFTDTTIKVNRVGYGAMQLAGPHVFGPPKDEATAIAILREAIELGVDHIDTSDFYGPYITNQIIKKALYPYPEKLTIVTKVGALRGPDSSWNPAFSKKELINAIHSNLINLGVKALDIVNFRFLPRDGDENASIAEAFSVLADLQQKGLIRHLGLSNVTPTQLKEAQKIAPVVCVQNMYNITKRKDDPFIDELAKMQIAYVPYFPLGGFSPIQSSKLNSIAASIDSNPMQVALAWLLQRSPNILLIPGTSSMIHLRENIKVRELKLTPEIIAQLNTI